MEGIQIVDRTLIITLSNSIDERELFKKQDQILNTVRTRKVEQAVLDLSAVRVMDSSLFEALRKMVKTLSVIGAESVIVGIQPGAASSLVELDVDTDGLITVSTMDDGLAFLKENAGRIK